MPIPMVLMPLSSSAAGRYQQLFFAMVENCLDSAKIVAIDGVAFCPCDLLRFYADNFIFAEIAFFIKRWDPYIWSSIVALFQRNFWTARVLIEFCARPRPIRCSKAGVANSISQQEQREYANY